MADTTTTENLLQLPQLLAYNPNALLYGVVPVAPGTTGTDYSIPASVIANYAIAYAEAVISQGVDSANAAAATAVSAASTASTAASTASTNASAASISAENAAASATATANSLVNYSTTTQMQTYVTGYALAKVNNLSDLASTTTARTNLGLGTAATVNTGTSGATIPLLNGVNTWASAQTFTSIITPTYPAGISGNKTGTAVTAGSVGEVLTATLAGTALTSGTTANAASLGLTAGDWDVYAVVSFNPASTTVFTGPMCAGVGTTSATLASYQYQQIYPTNTATASIQLVSPVVPISVSTTTTVYAHALSGVTVSTATVSARIVARRR